ncbi:MAG: FtsX-like permease family protein, partial [Candidatus Thorarchaeota archaeon]
MSERVDYASTDLRRRHFHFQMLLISVLSAMAFTTFLLLFGSAFFNVTEYVTSLGQLSVLYVFLTDFIWIALMFSLGLIMVLVSGMVYLEMVNRQRDIGLMKSIGIDLDTINDHFVVQSLVILLSGTALGVAVGSVAYMGSLVWLSAVLAGVELVFQYPILMIGLMVLLVILVGYLAAQQSIQRVINDTPIGALNPRVSKDVRHAGYLDSLGLSFRVASRATARRARGTKRVILSLFL